MRCKGALFALLAFLGVANPAQSVSNAFLFDTRYVWLQSRTDEQMQTFGIERSGDWARLRIASRVSHSGLNWNGVEYSINGELYLSWIRLTARLNHRNRFGDPSSSSTLFFSAVLDGRFPSFLSYFAEFGVYERLSQTKTNTLLPNFFRPAFTEYDLTLALGLRLHLGEKWVWQAQLATFDSVEVYNQNNPFVELASTWTEQEWTLRNYLRYQALLGFGLRDAWVAGLQVTLPLTVE